MDAGSVRARALSAGRALGSRERFDRATTTAQLADGEAVWSWHPLLMLSPAEVSNGPTGRAAPSIRGMTVTKRELVAGESAEETVKTIAWGMPVVSGASAVNTGAHTQLPQRAPGCGCIGHPAFPAPSLFSRGKVQSSSGRECTAGMRMRVWAIEIGNNPSSVMPRAKARSASSRRCRGHPRP